MYKGIVFIDYDGTLVDEKANISLPTQTTLNALQRLQQNKYLVTLCTGRARCHIPCEIQFQFDCYITSNGSCAEINHNIIYSKYFDEKDIPLFHQYFTQRGIHYTLERHNTCDCLDMDNYYLKKTSQHYRLPNSCYVPISKESYKNVNKIVAHYDNENRMTDFNDFFGEKYDIIPQNFQYSCDISLKGITKSTGIKAVLKFLHLDNKNTYAFGDGSNDIEMFQLVNTAIAMGKHAPDLTPYASFVTDPVADNGIKNALVRYGLI